VSVGTAFWPRQRELNTKESWGDWAGYFAPAVYADFHDIEYNAIREAAAVIDITPLYKFVISGPDATRLLDRVMTRDVSKLQVNQVSYTPWCDEEGKVLDDGTLTRLTDDSYRVTAADPSYRWFVLNATNLDVDVRDVSEATAGLALQGRLSQHVLEKATGEDWSPVRYFRRRLSSIAGIEVDVTRTGYTGDHGYELFMPADDALKVWDHLFEVGEAWGIRAAGIRALDVSRVEAGLILIGSNTRAPDTRSRRSRRIPRSRSASAGSSTSARRRTSTGVVRCSPSRRPAVRLGASSASSSSGAGSKGCTRSTASRR
jgi:aminomethyltransferase